MLHNVSELSGAKIAAKDRDLGHAEEFYFDDESWTVRYLVVDTAPLFFGKKVLISPYAIRHIAWNERAIFLNIDSDTVKESPEIDSQLPVSREKEHLISMHYGWPPYWIGDGVWGLGANPALTIELMREAEEKEGETPEEEPQAEAAGSVNHLRSSDEVLKYSVSAEDEKVGKVDDLSFDETDWRIRYLFVKAGSPFKERTVVLSTDWIDHISWQDSMIAVDVPKSLIDEAPSLIPPQKVGREFETRLVRYFDRKGYWE